MTLVSPSRRRLLAAAAGTLAAAPRLARAAAALRVGMSLADDAAGLIVMHDMNVPAASPRLRGLVSPQKWFLDFTPLALES